MRLPSELPSPLTGRVGPPSGGPGRGGPTALSIHPHPVAARRDRLPPSRGRWTNVGKALILIGAVLIAVGLVYLVGEKLGLGRLPGDIVIERENTRIYVPIMTCIVVSVALSFLFWLLGR